MSNQIRRISSHYLLTPQGLQRGGILSFDSEGTLLDIGAHESIDNKENVEFFSGLLIPGMVNAHCHLELSYLKGKIERGCGFAGFADGMAAARGQVSEQERAEAASYRDSKMYSEGVTAVGDIFNGASTFNIKKQSKIYYHNFIELFGLREVDCSSIRETVTEAGRMGLNFSATPHSVYSLQDVVLKEVSSWKYGQGNRSQGNNQGQGNIGELLSIHFMESKSEEELFHGYGRLYDRNVRDGLETDFAHYGSPANRLIASIPRGRKMLLIHNTFASEDDIRRITKYFGDENITWVLCPRSNAFIEGAIPPAALLKRMGANIAIGTDSLASNDSLSMIDEMHSLAEMDGGKIDGGAVIALEDILKWATIGGAEALGIDSWAGSFVPGKRPGAVLVSGIDWEKMRFTDSARSRRII